jgi:hypothetical protein
MPFLFIGLISFVVCSFLLLNLGVEDIAAYAHVAVGTIRSIRKALWAILQRHYAQKFEHAARRLGHEGNVVEVDESRFKRHGNVGRLLQAGWFWGAC